jgi:hypothetical protein
MARKGMSRKQGGDYFAVKVMTRGTGGSEALPAWR